MLQLCSAAPGVVPPTHRASWTAAAAVQIRSGSGRHRWPLPPRARRGFVATASSHLDPPVWGRTRLQRFFSAVASAYEVTAPPRICRQALPRSLCAPDAAANWVLCSARLDAARSNPIWIGPANTCATSRASSHLRIHAARRSRPCRHDPGWEEIFYRHIFQELHATTTLSKLRLWIFHILVSTHSKCNAIAYALHLRGC